MEPRLPSPSGLKTPTSLTKLGNFTFGHNPAPFKPRRLQQHSRNLLNRALPVDIAQQLDLDTLTSTLSHLSHSPLSTLLTFAYEPLVLPCQNMNCGDMVYRRYVLFE